VRASCTVPIILAPIKHEGRYLVDGALVNPVPIDLLKKMGADIVIAVNVTLPETENRDNGISRNRHKGPNILTIAFQTVNIISSQRLLACLQQADITISPQVNHIGRGDFQRADELIYQGELAAFSCEKEIKSLITG